MTPPVAPPPDRDRRIAGLRAVILSTGTGAAWLRWGLAAYASFFLLILAAAILTSSATWAGYLWTLVTATGCIGGALLFTAGYRTLRRREIAHTLAQLSQEDREAVLFPLRDQGGDTQKLVAPLLRRLGLPTEVSPAAPPAGRGSEPAAGTEEGSILE